MKVIALQTGFYGGSRRRAGTEFEVADGAKGSWFVPVETADAAQAVKAAKAAKAAKGETPVALSKVGTAPAQSFTAAMAAKDKDGDIA